VVNDGTREMAVVFDEQDFASHAIHWFGGH
jgi:hypothetical protein